MTARWWGTVCVAASAVLVLDGLSMERAELGVAARRGGRGEGSFSVVIEMPDVTSISPNSPVMVNDVTVGSISAIETDNWHARVTVRSTARCRCPPTRLPDRPNQSARIQTRRAPRRPPRWRRKGGCRKDP